MLGGVQVRIGNTIIDGSVRRRIDELRKKLLLTQVNEIENSTKRSVTTPSIVIDKESLQSRVENNQQIGDGRKRNRGRTHRKSYSAEVKRRAVALRDSGLTMDDVAKTLGTAKSNVEKWCSSKVILISHRT